jgi:hypothetical protein
VEPNTQQRTFNSVSMLLILFTHPNFPPNIRDASVTLKIAFLIMRNAFLTLSITEKAAQKKPVLQQYFLCALS